LLAGVALAPRLATPLVEKLKEFDALLAGMSGGTNASLWTDEGLLHDAR
jgi:hypothetical protein